MVNDNDNDNDYNDKYYHCYYSTSLNNIIIILVKFMKILTFPKIKFIRQVSNLCDDGSIFKIQNLNSIICMGEKKEKKRIGKERKEKARKGKQRKEKKRKEEKRKEEKRKEE